MQLLLTLLQDFFASARLHTVHKKIFTEESSALFVPPKLTTNAEKHFYPWFTSFNLKISST